ncbi:MAG: hypothetical protein K0Q72_5265 [Armatimonadetes bacterium]|jgi:hypothetical protein|nr:hypothetical protein [Armatimonadota bacterium]
MSEANDKIQSLVTAYAVLHTVDHILMVSTDLADARKQVGQLLALVQDKAQEEHVPAAMLRESGRDMLMELL